MVERQLRADLIIFAGSPVLPSFSESLITSLLEAMAWGLRSVVTPLRCLHPQCYLSPLRANHLSLNTPLLAHV